MSSATWRHCTACRENKHGRVVSVALVSRKPSRAQGLGGTEQAEASDVFWMIQSTIEVVNQRNSQIRFAIEKDHLEITH